jgi:gliding motility-associated-like protein
LTSGCFGSATGGILIDSLSGGQGPYEYSLDGEFFLSTGPLPFTIPNLTAGSYTLYVQDGNDCVQSSGITVQDASQLVLELGENREIDLGDSVLLKPLLNFTPDSWTWTPVDFIRNPDSLETFTLPVETTTYRLTVIDANGCEATDLITIMVDTGVPVFVPSAFSPDDDGINDLLTIYAGKGVRSIIRFMIFDRWGNQIYVDGPFQPNDPAHGWNGRFKGKHMNPAVFVYHAEVELVDGRIVMIKGDVALLR